MRTEHKGINVEIIDEAFPMPQLLRTRRIWVYKPSSYDECNLHYPVVYMHDGQNLFDEATAFGEEWGVDETLHSMLADCIIIGIDNSEHRMTEYNFHNHREYGIGEGRKYIRFIVETLKPYIDKHYRTKPQREYTNIAGSSMGGLITLYGALYFAETFGGAGIFSPALWLVPDAKEEIRLIAENNAHLPQRFYFYGGSKEGSDMVLHINYIANLLNQYPFYSVDVDIDVEGEHTESHWRNRFADFYTWLYQERGAEVFNQ